MRVCHVVHWPKSGITSVVRDLITYSVKHDIESSVLLLIGDDSDIAFFKDARSVHILDVSSGFLRAASRFRELLRQIDPDILHAHSFTPLLMSYISRIAGCRLISTVHSDYPYFTERNLKSLAKRLLFRVASRREWVTTIAVADHVADLIERTFVKTIGVKVINNGVPVSSSKIIDSDLRDKLMDAADGKVVFATVGRLSPEKNYSALIEGFAGLQQRDRCLLIVVGDGCEFAHLKELTQQLGCLNDIIFTGYVESPAWVIELSDLFICSSLHEGFPLVLLEAMRAQKPILSTPVVAAQRLAEKGCLRLIEGFSSVDISKSLSASYDNLKDLAGLAENANQVLRAEFTTDVMAQKYIELYQREGRSSRI